MTTSQYFLWLTQQAWGMLFLYPPFAVVTLILLIGIVASLVRQGLLGRSPIRDRSWLAFLLLLTPWLILLVGTVGRASSSPTEVHSFGLPYFLLLALMLVHGLVYVLLTYFLPDSRLFVTCMFLFTDWLLWWAVIVATMSVTGDWI